MTSNFIFTKVLAIKLLSAWLWLLYYTLATHIYEYGWKRGLDFVGKTLYCRGLQAIGFSTIQMHVLSRNVLVSHQVLCKTGYFICILFCQIPVDFLKIFWLDLKLNLARILAEYWLFSFISERFLVLQYLYIFDNKIQKCTIRKSKYFLVMIRIKQGIYLKLYMACLMEHVN